MDPPLLILTLGVCVSFLALSVQSQQNVNPGLKSVPPPSKKSAPHPPPPVPPPLARPSPLPQQTHHPPPPTNSLHSAPQMTTTSESKHPNHDKFHGQSPPPKKKKKKKTNWGKKLGFTFVGVAAVLQVCVLAFLLTRRRQLLKAGGGF